MGSPDHGHRGPVSDLAIEALLDSTHPLKVETAEWARAELAKGDRVRADRESIFAADDWKRCAARGIQGLLVAEEFGGQGRDIISALLVLEGLGLGCRDNGLTFAIGSQIVSTQHAIDQFGTTDQKQRWLPGLCDGSLFGAFAITEPESGSDPFALSARAEKNREGAYRLSGHKAYITLGSVCDVVVVFASTDPDAGRWGLSAFVVASDTPGVEIQPNREKMGMRTTPFGDIVFDGAIVGENDRLGPEGAGSSIFGSHSRSRACLRLRHARWRHGAPARRDRSPTLVSGPSRDARSAGSRPFPTESPT